MPKNFNNDGTEYDDPNSRPYAATELPCTSGRSGCYCLSGRCRAIEQLNEQREVIASFCSAADASRKVGGGTITNSMISMHCTGILCKPYEHAMAFVFLIDTRPDTQHSNSTSIWRCAISHAIGLTCATRIAVTPPPYASAGRTKLQGNYWFRFRDPPLIAGVRKTAHPGAVDPKKVEDEFKEVGAD